MTITVEEDVARWARIWAAEHGSSVSRLVGQLLKEQMKHEKSYAAAMRRALKREPVRLKDSEGYPKRDELYDRPVLRGH